MPNTNSVVAKKQPFITIVKTTTLLGRQRYHAMIQGGNNEVLMTSEKFYNRLDAEGNARLVCQLDPQAPFRYEER